MGNSSFSTIQTPSETVFKNLDFPSGAGTPVGVVTPVFRGQVYTDTSTSPNTMYIATDLTNTDWEAFTNLPSGSGGGGQIETLPGALCQAFITVNNQDAFVMPCGVSGTVTVSEFEFCLRNNFLGVGNTVDIEIGLYDSALNLVGTVGAATITNADPVGCYTVPAAAAFAVTTGQYFLSFWKDTPTGGNIQPAGLNNGLNNINVNFIDQALAGGLPATLTRDIVNTNLVYLAAR